jgi:NitT/TauT family transport system substrate-binding protein
MFSAPTFSRRGLGTLAAASVAAAAGCRSGRSGAKSVDHVTYLTSFGVSGRESYPWVAKAKGFFADAGLDVTIRAGAAGDSNHQLLGSGKAHFAAVDSSGAFVRYGRGTDRSFHIVAAIHQATLLSIVTLDDRGITGPHDLAGRRLAAATGSAPRTLFPAYAKLANIDTAKISWVESAPAQLTPLLTAGKVDGIGLFAVGAPGVEKAAGRKAVVLTYSTYINDLFGNVLVTPKSLARSNPDLVRRFAGAMMRGLLYAVDHPDECGAILHAAEPSQDPLLAAQELHMMRSYSVPQPGQTVGVLDPARVARTVAVLQAVDLVPSAFPPDDFVRADLLGTAPVA